MKTCSYCAEQIQDAAVRCRFCSSDLTSTPPAEALPNDGTTVTLKELLARGQKIEAIRYLRTERHMDLRDASRVVEQLSGRSGSAISKNCQFCKSDMPGNASTCAHCGKQQTNPAVTFVVLMIGLGVGVWTWLSLQP